MSLGLRGGVMMARSWVVYFGDEYYRTWVLHVDASDRWEAEMLARNSPLGISLKHDYGAWIASVNED